MLIMVVRSYALITFQYLQNIPCLFPNGEKVVWVTGFVPFLGISSIASSANAKDEDMSECIVSEVRLASNMIFPESEMTLLT